MNIRRGLILWVLAFGIVTLTACSSDQQTADSGGTGGTGMAMGTVTGFGSVFVNGVEYDTNGASITMDGVPSSETDLGIGMVVTVHGTVDASGLKGVADTIDYKKRILGPISSVDTGAKTFVVMNQTVQVTASTIFSGTATFDSLTQNLWVEISGFSAPDTGTVTLVRATYIDVKTSAGTAEVKGRIDSGSVTDTHFSINTLSVDFSGVSSSLAFIPAPGQFVEVHGTYNGTALVADEVSLGEEGVSGSDGDEIDIEGIIFDVGSDVLTINGQQVTTVGAQLDGLVLDATAVGMRVEIEGRIVNGSLTAESIQAKQEGELEIGGQVQAIDPNTSTVTLYGKTIRIDSDTVIDQKATFFSDTYEGEFLKVHGYLSGAEIVATQIEKESSAVYELQGPIDDNSIIPGVQFSIVGIVVEYNSVTTSGTGYVTSGATLHVTGDGLGTTVDRIHASAISPDE